MAVRMTLRSVFLLAMVTVVCLVAATYAVAVYHVRKQDMLQEANVKLLTAGHLARTLAGPGYHDRIADRTSISKEMFERVVERNDELCLSMGLQYVWSLLLVDGKLVFTTATHSVLTNKQSDCAAFFDVHTNPEAYRRALETMQPEFTTFHDKWGDGRMVLLPAWDTHRRKYLFAASMQLQNLDALLSRTLAESVLFSLLIASGFSLLAIVLSRRLTHPLTRLTEAINRLGKGDPEGVLPEAGLHELAVLADSFEKMRRTIREQMEALRASEERFRGLVDNLGVGVALIGPQMEVLALNRQMQLWCPEAKLGGEPLCKRTFYHAPHAGVCTDCPVVKALTAGGRHEMTTEVEKAGGKQYFRILASPLKDSAGRIIAAIELVEDITDRQRITAALAQSQADLKAILESTPDIIFSVDASDGRLRHFNSAFAREMERSCGMQVRPGMQAQDVLPADTLQVWVEMIQRALAQGPFSTEYIRPSDHYYFDVSFNPILQAGQVAGLSVFIRDITARKRAEVAWLENEALLRNFFDSPGMSRGVVELEGDDFRFISSNVTTAQNLGLKKEEVLNKSMRELGYPDEARRWLLAQLVECHRIGQPHSFEYHQQAPGRDRWLYFTVSDLGLGPAGKRRFAYAAANITERKHAEAALMASEARYRDLFTTMTEGLALHQVVYDAHGLPVDYVVLEVNPAFERLTGFQRSKIVGQRATLAYGVAQAPRLDVYARVAQTMQPASFEEYFGQPPKHFRVTVYAPQTGYFATLLEDVTEHRHMTDALRKSQAQLAAVLESTQDMIWAVDAQSYALLCFNPAFATFTQRMFGVVLQPGMTARQVLPADRFAAWEPLFRGAITRGAYTVEYRVPNAPMDLEVTFNPIREHGRVVAIAMFGRDVTARKQAQAALRESQAHLTAVLESTEDLIWSMDARTLNILAYNTAFADEVLCTYGVRLQPGLNLREIIPADRMPAWQELLHRAIREGRYTDEFFRPNRPRYFERTFNPIVKEGQAVSVSIFARDITERKRADQALRESEEKFTRMATHLESVLYSVDAETREFRYISPAFKRLFGYTLEDVRNMGGRRTFLHQVIQNGRFVHQDQHMDALAREPSGLGAHLEGWWRCKDGTLRYVQDHWMPVYVEGKLVSTEGILTDVTQAKLAENKLRESEAQLKHAQQLAKLGNWTWDVATDTVTWSEEIFDIFGWNKLQPPPSMAEHAKLFPAENWPYVQSVLEQAAQSGESYELETIYQRQDGMRGHLLMHGEAFRDAQGRVVHLRGTAQDITERKRLEQQILEISEREQRRFGHDLHDGIGQQLTALRFMTTTLLQQVASQEKVDLQAVESLDTQLGETLKQVRHVARGLHPVSADSQGLMHSLRDLCRQCQPLFGVTCAFECPAPVALRDQQAAQNLYRIAQEAIRNAAAHGAPQHIHVRLQQDESRVYLVVSDDGKGLPRESRKKRGLGLDIMRYRANAIGATLEIQSKPGAGVTIRCTWPAGK